MIYCISSIVDAVEMILLSKAVWRKGMSVPELGVSTLEEAIDVQVVEAGRDQYDMLRAS